MRHSLFENSGWFGSFLPSYPSLLLLVSDERVLELKSRKSLYLYKLQRNRKFLMTTQKQASEQQQSQILRASSNPSITMGEREEEITRSAFSAFRAKEEEIERKKMEMREKVHARLGRMEEESKRLAEIQEELQALADPLKKEVISLRKKLDLVDKELKLFGQTCLKKEREHKEALDALNEKNGEKSLLITNLMELVGESERLRMKKLEELSKNINSLH